MAESKKEYDALVEMRNGIAEELAIPRCHNCDHNISGTCYKFNQEIPDEHKYKYTECKLWEKELPF